MTTLLNKTIRLFSEGIGRRDEYEFYLNKFQTDDHPCFAILCPEREGFEDAAPFFAFDIHFLLQLELSPAILLCGPDSDTMQPLLEREDHPFASIECLGEMPDVQPIHDFLTSCVREGKCGLVKAPDASWETLLPALVPEISRRVHYIRSAGPLRARSNQPIFQYYTARNRPDELLEDDRPLLAQATALLDRHPGTHISIASPWNLLQELFTVKGAGCIVRRGSQIQRVQGPGEVDMARLRQLMENSFRKTLFDADRLQAVSEFYLEANYRGAALLEETPQGMYLSKFAVGTEARGEGLSVEIWQDVVLDHPRLFWRASLENPIQQWYEKQADGHHRDRDWIVYWRGIPGADVSSVIDYCLARPNDFIKHA